MSMHDRIARISGVSVDNSSLAGFLHEGLGCRYCGELEVGIEPQPFRPGSKIESKHIRVWCLSCGKWVDWLSKPFYEFFLGRALDKRALSPENNANAPQAIGSTPSRE
jgi:hypothetical protein